MSRTGRSGIVTRFRRFSLPSPLALEDFQAVWTRFEGPAQPGVCVPSTLTIRGRVWTGSDGPDRASDRGGLLELREIDGAILIGMYELVIGRCCIGGGVAEESVLRLVHISFPASAS